MLTFNTGRKYSAKGQRIAAAVVDGRTYFVDADRCIDGVFTAPVALTESKVLAAYDRGAFQGCYHPVLRDLHAAAASI
jgi:hypothetical protein